MGKFKKTILLVTIIRNLKISTKSVLGTRLKRVVRFELLLPYCRRKSWMDGLDGH
jgi:hypothetical protein